MSGTTKLTGKKLRIALKMLDRVTSFLENNKIPYLLEGGTLLGIIREQRLLPWDNDIDLTIIEQFKPLLLKNIWKLRLIGLRVKVKKYQREIGPFKLGETRIVKIRNYRLLFFRGDVMIDLFIKRRIGDRYFWTVGIKNPVLKSAPASFYEKLDQVNYNGKFYSVPADYAAYLTYRYGDWKTPVKTWNFKKDDQAIVAHQDQVGD